MIDAILDAASQGSYTVRRESFAATYRSRFTLVGTMNPEEGTLRPQIMDRFGLRLLVKGLEQPEDRLEAYNRSRAYFQNPKMLVDLYADETMIARDEIEAARELLPRVVLPDEIAKLGLLLVQKMKIASLRAEISLFEAARALAAADSRLVVSEDDLRHVAPMALRLRRSEFISDYIDNQAAEETEIAEKLGKKSKKG